MLAEELFAIFQDDIPIQNNAPVTFTNPNSNLPTLTLSGNDDAPPLQLKGLDGTKVNMNVSGGNITFTNPTTNNTTNVTQVKVTRTVFAALVVSGTGTSYQIKLDSNVTVASTALGVLSTDLFPPGTAGIAVKSGNSYLFVAQLRTSFVGTVQSGAGSSYTVLLDDNRQVTVTVPGPILGSATLPAGAALPVLRMNDGTFQMLVPIWYM
jgi:hypothetical protein